MECPFALGDLVLQRAKAVSPQHTLQWSALSIGRGPHGITLRQISCKLHLSIAWVWPKRGWAERGMSQGSIWQHRPAYRAPLAVQSVTFCNCSFLRMRCTFVSEIRLEAIRYASDDAASQDSKLNRGGDYGSWGQSSGPLLIHSQEVGLIGMAQVWQVSLRAGATASCQLYICGQSYTV